VLETWGAEGGRSLPRVVAVEGPQTVNSQRSLDHSLVPTTLSQDRPVSSTFGTGPSERPVTVVELTGALPRNSYAEDWDYARPITAIDQPTCDVRSWNTHRVIDHRTPSRLGLTRFGGHPRSGAPPREDVHHGDPGQEAGPAMVRT